MSVAKELAVGGSKASSMVLAGELDGASFWWMWKGRAVRLGSRLWHLGSSMGYHKMLTLGGDLFWRVQGPCLFALLAVRMAGGLMPNRGERERGCWGSSSKAGPRIC